MDFRELLLVSLASSAVLGYALLLAVGVGVVVLVHKRETLLRGAATRHERLCRRLREKSLERRKLLVHKAQRRNIKELASLVRAGLKSRRRELSPWARHEAESLAREAVDGLDFERLHALHSLIEGSAQDGLSRELERFLRQET
ncbi:hypothetical protein NNJEOMEG_00027 [Fundidesulfovibrio magnetotacticus]|uniref:Uncharacterized protein n=1 Tax=Fundidesulfovibrio magnetotacticus TaxID=2730080 RepID=A0A6V8LR20_9BACT|nr:hypothetical protein [Fundidesulfovibrio magnetotacticus]GFK92206.1 hypothetical protein NNJEOMEG_00027 [Fundidesulfovibrio magnetotacticus]